MSSAVPRPQLTDPVEDLWTKTAGGCMYPVGYSRVTGGEVPAMLGSTFRNIQDGVDTPLMVEDIDVTAGDLLHVMVMCEVQNQDASTDAVLAIEMQPHASFSWGAMAYGTVPPVTSLDGDSIMTTGDQVDPFANPPTGAHPGWWINPMQGTGSIDLRISFATTDTADIINVDSFLWVASMRFPT